jgi:hypothetical protein
MSTSRWHTVCVHYHDERGHDALLLDAVRPLFAQLVDAVDGAHFTRHWRRGPHLRLNVRTTPESLRRTVLPAIRATVGDYLRRRPSTSTVDPLTLVEAHRSLARAERDDGQLWPWRQDNSVHEEPYDSRAAVLGSQEAAELIADFHVAANESAFAALAAMRAGAGRLWSAFDLMVTTAHACAAGGVSRGYVSFRAHAEVFLAGTTAPEDLREAWQRAYRQAAPMLRERLTRATTGESSEPARLWLDALATVRARGFALVDGDRLRMDNAPAGRPVPPEVSPFLRELITNDDFHERFMPSPAFRRYRLLLNLLYLHLTRIGIRPAERYLLAHLVSNTVENVFGVDPVAVLRTNSSGAAS